MILVVAMQIDLSGRTAVITGASRGLGEAMAKALAEAGAHVALVARDVKRLESVRDGIIERGGTAAFFVGDVTREEDVARVAGAVKERFRACADPDQQRRNEFAQERWSIIRWRSFAAWWTRA